MNAPAGVLITAEAAALLAGLQDRHGPVMFHQSGGLLRRVRADVLPAGGLPGR